MRHIAYPDIPQLRELVNTIKHHYTYQGRDEQGEPIFDESLPKPVLTFTGTVKIHGSNLSMVLFKDGTLQFQSREMILDDHNDLYNFYHTYKPHEENIKKWLSQFPFDEYVVVYGEWCGKGIQAKCAIQQLDKRFIAFGLKIDDTWHSLSYFDPLHNLNIFTIDEFPKYRIIIDFNDPSESIPELNRLTQEVENECPVAKSFGVSGIGEGIVWKCDVRKVLHNDELKTYNYWFKTKGEKHALKDNSPKEIDPLVVEMYENCDQFVKANLSENRLAQGISKIEEKGLKVTMQDIGTFLKWCVEDIKKECYLEIEQNGYDQKVLNKQINKSAREYFLNYINSNL